MMRGQSGGRSIGQGRKRGCCRERSSYRVEAEVQNKVMSRGPCPDTGAKKGTGEWPEKKEEGASEKEAGRRNGGG